MIRKSNKTKIKEFFLLKPTIKVRVRQLERIIKVPLPSITRYVKELETECIIKSINIANIKIYTANRSAKQFISKKRIFNLQQIHNSGIIDYLIKKYDNPTVIIFGSYVKGEDIETSDIDLYIETQHKNIKNLEQYEKKLYHNIQIFAYTNIREIKNKELANNIINGITLNGFLEVLR